MFVNKEGEFTGCNCGNCADALISAHKIYEEAIQINDGCTVWALMLAEAFITAAKATFTSTGVQIGLEEGMPAEVGIAITMGHMRLVKDAMQKAVMTTEGTKATHEVIMRTMKRSGEEYVTLDTLLNPKRT